MKLKHSQPPRTSLPPRCRIRSEISFGPWSEADGVVLADLDVGEGEAERGGASDDFAGVVVLGAVAGAHVFVGSSVPRDDATQVSADCVDGIIFKAIGLDNQVVSITLETLNKISITCLMSCKP